MDRKITTESVAVNAAETEPIVLRETDTRRLVFQAMIVDQPAAPVRGFLVYQRKLKGDEWEDLTGESFNSLKAGEGWKLELHAEEVATLLQGISDRKEIYDQFGIQFGERGYLEDSTLPEVVRKMVEEPESELATVLQTLDPAELLSLGRSVDLSKLDGLLAEWDANEGNPDEEYWQDLLRRNSWVFSQLTGSPVVLLKDKAYVGGKSIENTGGRVVDYLVKNALTDNMSLIEIKTPAAELCTGEYRSGTFPPGPEVAGGLVQVLSYRDSLIQNVQALRAESETPFQSYNPNCYLIAGLVSALSEGEKRSFELFRNAQSSAHIISFDEIRVRLQGIRDVLVRDEVDPESESSLAIVDASQPDDPPAFG